MAPSRGIGRRENGPRRGPRFAPTAAFRSAEITSSGVRGNHLHRTRHLPSPPYGQIPVGVLVHHFLDAARTATGVSHRLSRVLAILGRRSRRSRCPRHLESLGKSRDSVLKLVDDPEEYGISTTRSHCFAGSSLRTTASNSTNSALRISSVPVPSMERPSSSSGRRALAVTGLRARARHPPYLPFDSDGRRSVDPSRRSHLQYELRPTGVVPRFVVGVLR